MYTRECRSTAPATVWTSRQFQVGQLKGDSAVSAGQWKPTLPLASEQRQMHKTHKTQMWTWYEVRPMIVGRTQLVSKNFINLINCINRLYFRIINGIRRVINYTNRLINRINRLIYGGPRAPAGPQPWIRRVMPWINRLMKLITWVMQLTHWRMLSLKE